METRDIVMIIILILMLIIGCVYYVYYIYNTPSKNPSTIDPRTNLTNVVKATIQKNELTPTAEPKYPNDITKTVLKEWPILIALVKKITGKPVSLCIDMPSTLSFIDDGRISQPGSPMYILFYNIPYVTKSAYIVSAENGNFHDIAALFFQEMKVSRSREHVFSNIKYDGGGQLSELSVNFGGTGMTIGNFLDIFKSLFPIKITDVIYDGTDPEYKSFAEKMIPF